MARSSKSREMVSFASFLRQMIQTAPVFDVRGADGIVRHQSFILELKNLSEKVGDHFVSDRLPEHQKLWTS